VLKGPPEAFLYEGLHKWQKKPIGTFRIQKLNSSAKIHIGSDID
jgi:hypothetical protein